MDEKDWVGQERDVKVSLPAIALASTLISAETAAMIAVSGISGKAGPLETVILRCHSNFSILFQIVSGTQSTFHNCDFTLYLTQ